MTGQFARTEVIGAVRSRPQPSTGNAPCAGRADVLHRLGPVGWAPSGSAPPGPPNGGGHGGHYLPETPEGGLGRSHSPYGITVQKAGTVPAQHRPSIDLSDDRDASELSAHEARCAAEPESDPIGGRGPGIRLMMRVHERLGEEQVRATGSDS